jgi:hypothetical protein
MAMNDIARIELQAGYINHIIDSMDGRSLYEFVQEVLEERIGEMTDTQLLEDIQEWAPHLLEN